MAAEAGTDAPRPPRCPNRAGVGMAAHRPPHALPGRLHRPGSARCQSRHAAHLHARRPDAQRHSHARHQAAQFLRHADPPNRAGLAPRLSPGRQGRARSHVPPNPRHADRTSLPPRLPPPLPSGLPRTPHTVGRWVTWARSSVRAQVIRRTAATRGRQQRTHDKQRTHSSEGRLRYGSDPHSRCPAASYSPTRSPAQYHRR